MAYADYFFYMTEYGGREISESDFCSLANRASDYIDYITRDKADPEDVKVKKACCAMAEQYQKIQQASAEDKKSETVGSWSATFMTGDERTAAAEKKIFQIATRYLIDYMYRGGCSCTCRM